MHRIPVQFQEDTSLYLEPSNLRKSLLCAIAVLVTRDTAANMTISTLQELRADQTMGAFHLAEVLGFPVNFHLALEHCF